MISLLDANVLIALGDRDHPQHRSVLRFFDTTAMLSGWATCPLTENAFLRILGNPVYPGGQGSTERARRSLASIIAVPGHRFWSDSLSISDERLFPSLPSCKNLTDFYLLALAVKHRGRLATFDRRIDPTLLIGGTAAYYLIG